MRCAATLFRSPISSPAPQSSRVKAVSTLARGASSRKTTVVKPDDRRFFQRDPLTCARELIGCELVWNECAGIIVETEAYYAVGDEACHTFARPSARAFIANHEAGAAYVYFNYGMYWLLHVLVKGGRHDGFVLFHAFHAWRGSGEADHRARCRWRRSRTGPVRGRRRRLSSARGANKGPGGCARRHFQ